MAQGACSLPRLDNPNSANLFKFATTMDLSGNVLVVGTEAETAYVYEKINGTWTLVQTLTPPDQTGLDRFGSTVAVDGDTVLIGSPRHQSGAAARGAIYVYQRVAGIWTFQTKLVLNTAIFGRIADQIAFRGNVAAASAISDGAIYVFTRDTGVWSSGVRATGSDTDGGDQFGTSISTDGVSILVGASQADPRAYGANSAGSGAAYVFVRDGQNWVQQAKLFNPNPSPFVLNAAGTSVAILGDCAVVSSTGGPNPYFLGSTGNGYVFRRSANSWTLEQTLGYEFNNSIKIGTRVALTTDRIAVSGSTTNWYFSNSQGMVCLFDRTPNGWFGQSVRAGDLSDSNVNARFGGSMAFDGQNLLVGASGQDVQSVVDLGTIFLINAAPPAAITLTPQLSTICAGQALTLNAAPVIPSHTLTEWTWQAFQSDGSRSSWRGLVDGMNVDLVNRPYFTATNANTTSPILTPVPVIAEYGNVRIEVKYTTTDGCTTREESIIWRICRGDINCSGAIDTGDIFDYLNAWFAQSPIAEFDGSPGVTVADLFQFLNSWFTGCP